MLESTQLAGPKPVRVGSQAGPPYFAPARRTSSDGYPTARPLGSGSSGKDRTDDSSPSLPLEATESVVDRQDRSRQSNLVPNVTTRNRSSGVLRPESVLQPEQAEKLRKLDLLKTLSNFDDNADSDDSDENVNRTLTSKTLSHGRKANPLGVRNMERSDTAPTTTNKKGRRIFAVCAPQIVSDEEKSPRCPPPSSGAPEPRKFKSSWTNRFSRKKKTSRGKPETLSPISFFRANSAPPERGDSASIEPNSPGKIPQRNPSTKDIASVPPSDGLLSRTETEDFEFKGELVGDPSLTIRQRVSFDEHASSPRCAECEFFLNWKRNDVLLQRKKEEANHERKNRRKRDREKVPAKSVPNPNRKKRNKPVNWHQQWRTVIFIRHGQSEWNLAKSKGKQQKGMAFMQGLAEVIDKSADPKIKDSPLSSEGIAQSQKLGEFLEKNRRKKIIVPSDEHQRASAFLARMASVRSTLEQSIRLLSTEVRKATPEPNGPASPESPGSPEKEEVKSPGPPTVEVIQGLSEALKSLDDACSVTDSLSSRPREEITLPVYPVNPHNLATFDLIDLMASSADHSVLCSSNLRRALSTLVIALWPRLKKNPEEQVVILSCLQELGRNIDTMTLHGKDEVPMMSRLEREASIVKRIPNLDDIYTKQIDTSENHGDQHSAGKKHQMTDFASYCFRKNKPVVIACGHSGWIRSFFRTFLPPYSNKNPKKRKLDNCSVIAASLCSLTDLGHGIDSYYICPKSIKLLYGDYKIIPK